MRVVLCIIVFLLAIGAIDISLENIYQALDKIADERKELRKQLK